MRQFGSVRKHRRSDGDDTSTPTLSISFVACMQNALNHLHVVFCRSLLSATTLALLGKARKENDKLILTDFVLSFRDAEFCFSLNFVAKKKQRTRNGCRRRRSDTCTTTKQWRRTKISNCRAKKRNIGESMGRVVSEWMPDDR